MGKRGPKRTPTAILEARGSKRAKYDRPHEPRPPSLVPEMPRGLSSVAKRAWRDLTAHLRAMRVVAEIDGRALERYCRLWAEWRKRMRAVERNDALDDTGLPTLLRVGDQLSRIEAKFGMTPSDRASLVVPDEEEVRTSEAERRYG